MDLTATAKASPNIAFIKYWGNTDENLRLPVNGSISMNMSGLATITKVIFDSSMEEDELSINGKIVSGQGLARASTVLDAIREFARVPYKAIVSSENNFPSGAGIASSASAFAALAFAGVKALAVDVSVERISRFARLGSGSASRSVPDGYVEWFMGKDDDSSYATSIAQAGHWELSDCVVILSEGHKKTGSTEGHKLAPSSPFQVTRVLDAPRRIALCREAVLNRDFEQLGRIIQQDSDMMHAVMMTSDPALFYWLPETLRIMNVTRTLQAEGLPVAYTIDAGPNVHLICESKDADEVAKIFANISGVKQILRTKAGPGARLIE